MTKIILRILVWALTVGLPFTVTAEEWKVASPDYAWSFPKDHWAREGFKTEWWYFTGHLDSEKGDRFGYQFTFFRIGLLPEKPDMVSDWTTENLIMGHAAISDLDSGKHVFSEVIYRAMPLLGGFGSYPDSVLAWSRGPAGTGRQWELRWNGEAFDFEMEDRWQKIGFSLSTRPVKPLIFQGPNGFSQKAESSNSASQYYSFTRLQTEGSLSLGETSHLVTGTSWMDKEFGSNQLSKSQVGWDWFSLQLEDGRDLMVYMIRDSTGNVDFARGTVVTEEGKTRFLSQGDFEVQVTAKWKSDQTEAEYPAGWRVSVPGENLQLTVQPQMAAQENWSRSLRTLFYWEGAVRVLDGNGKAIGQGYVELVGYGTKSMPAI